MVFIPRHPVIQNQFLVHDSAVSTTATAGCVVYLSGSEKVACVTGTNTTPYGFLLQNVKAESAAHPTGFRLPGDLGSSDAFTGDPVGVAHLGVYDTTNYASAALPIAAGSDLYSTSAGQLTNSAGSGALGVKVAVAQNTVTTAGASLRVKIII